SGPAAAADLPDGPGKAETTRLCGKCHPVEQAVSLRQGQAAWTETIAKMVELGAAGSTAEFTTILTYLVKNYGSRNSTPQQPASSPAVTVEPRVQSPATTAQPAPKIPQDRKITTPSNPGPPIAAAKEWRTYGHD